MPSFCPNIISYFTTIEGLKIICVVCVTLEPHFWLGCLVGCGAIGVVVRFMSAALSHGLFLCR